MKFGDRVRIEMLDGQGQTIFGGCLPSFRQIAPVGM
jgi:hypothetical protein